ncbi:ADP compounds hydrolase NudE [Echinimonas agarilytica]|uniref:ADP compounds hydrolase NudE n=1 Tax=Echinimonas agarilytica TaxID=1215918 RepID=A0AA41W963_9GAMM|nr:ADP compounds hydrolase NudE [Echinimonas agarilytica]MCM2680882.1 ADP compounds hydrolase NudE [Echinimonas agarilytica]
MDLQKLKLPTIHARRVVAKSRLFQIESLDLEFSNGETRQYERLGGNGRGAVMVVPITEDGDLILIREYSAGTESYELGFPKGLIDAGETAEQAGLRELQEEVGLGAKRLTPLKKVTLAPSYFAAHMQLLMAHDLYPSKLEGDEPEPLVIVKWPLNHWQQLLDSDEFTEARSVNALMLAARLLGLWETTNGAD